MRGPALLGLISVPSEDQAVLSLSVAEIRTGGAHQPRRRAQEANLETLATSIRERGILQPLLVRSTSSGYELVAGERRLRAAVIAGLTQVPVLVRELTDHEALEAALIENLQREGLEIIDEVDSTLSLVANRLLIPREAARERLLEHLRRPERSDGLPELEALFQQLGRGSWQSFTKNKLRILNWPEAVLSAMRDNGLPYTIAGIIAAAPADHQSALLAFALKPATKLEVRAEAQRLNPPKARGIDRQLSVQLAKRLSSERWLASLGKEDQHALEAWLKKMPDRVRQALQKQPT
ncbi:ParB/RepB/Spo0J family partition protein [Deinococcus sp. UYEF24]